MNPSDIIDISNPTWDEIINWCLLNRSSERMTPSTWPRFIKFFGKQQLQDFLEVCTDINACEEVIIFNIILAIESAYYANSKRFEFDVDKCIELLQYLVNNWNYDLTKYDCIDICLKSAAKVKSKIKFTKFCLAQGLTFQKTTVNFAAYYDFEIIQLMVQHDVDMDEITHNIIESVKRQSPSLLRKLQFLNNSGVDIAAHICDAKISDS
jgi:hypothetical protein